jgi:nicotinate-nucleotide adenylyltransferase
MTRRVGILGGTFDPIHRGHLDLADAAQRVLALTEILVIPSNIPPHRPQPIASSWHRFAMVALAIVGRSGWRASDIELAGGAGPSFTSATLRRFEDAGYTAAELFFLTGADAFAEIESWRDFPAILDRAEFVVVSRPGFPVSGLARRLPAIADRMQDADRLSDRRTEAGRTSIFLIDAATADVSATAIRQAAANGRPISGLVPDLVERYIEQHGVYTPSSSAAAAGQARVSTPAGRLHGQN